MNRTRPDKRNFPKEHLQTIVDAAALLSAALIMVIGFMVYGIESQGGLNWSFAITVIAAVLTVVAGALAVVQMRQSGVRL